MKFKNLYIIIIIILFIIIPQNTIISENTEKYLDIIGSILNVTDSECYKDLNKILDFEKKNNIEYPWLMDYMGKGLNDLGDETECINSLVNTSFIIVRAKATLRNKNEEFLDTQAYSYGFCINNKCKDTVKNNFEIIRKFLDILFSSQGHLNNGSMYEIIESNEANKKNNSNITSYIPIYLRTEDNYFIKSILIIFFIYILLKFIVGIFRMVFIPKGYNKYALEILNQKENLGSIDEEEQINLSKRKESIITFSEGNLNEYDPHYDFSSFLPIKLRILRFFDIFNDFMLLTKKSNRYYNDQGLEIIALMRFISLFFLIFTETFNTLISLPSEDIFNTSFFKSNYLALYRLSINSLTCLIVLEGANTNYKLNKFIKSRMYDNNKNNKSKFGLQLLITCIKFLFYFIPKLLIFLISYYLFYYRAEDFVLLINSKTTYQYIINKIFTNNIKCKSNPFPIFNNYTSFWSYNIADYCHCYEFTYYNFNILFCTLCYILIIYLSFLFRNKLFDFCALLLNLFFFFFYTLIITDDNNEKEYYSYYHFLGQKYSTKIIYSFIGFYHIGFILGILLFYIDNEINYKGYLKISINNEKKENLSEDEIILDDSKISNKNEIKENILPYYPMPFLKNFILWLYKIDAKIRGLIIFLCVSSILVLSYVYNMFVFHEGGYAEIKLSSLEFYFYYEKHLFIIFFFIIIILLNSLINKDSFILNTKIIYIISRSGFTIICQYYFLSYISLSTYFIKVKYHILIFLLISVGNFIFFSICSFLFNAAFEIPIKRAIKKLLSLKKEKKII